MILYPCDLYNYSICRGVVNPAPEYEKIVTRIYREMKRILDLATNYGFDKNIWHNYLVFLLITNENSFSITNEKVGESDGTVNHFAKNDF
ncbi:hypothetical protein [Clostridium estertheticum]|uniref:hypothetical protein n=1 Tax=Clostridium estertheticum TaxID=238834 RepID=UPI00404A70B9